MKEILRTTNPVLLSRVRAVLEDDGIQVFHLDYNTSVIEGSVGALPQRLMVADHDIRHSIKILENEGLGGEITTLEANGDDG